MLYVHCCVCVCIIDHPNGISAACFMMYAILLHRFWLWYEFMVFADSSVMWFRYSFLMIISLKFMIINCLIVFDFTLLCNFDFSNYWLVLGRYWFCGVFLKPYWIILLLLRKLVKAMPTKFYELCAQNIVGDLGKNQYFLRFCNISRNIFVNKNKQDWLFNLLLQRHVV